MTERPSTPTLGDMLASRRQRRLVGRAHEVGCFRAALDSHGPAVLYIYGPGGIGKTSVLDLFADVAAQSQVDPIRLDGRDVGSTQSILDMVDHHPRTTGRLVLLIDSYERLAPLDGWFRTDLMPRLPTTAIIVLAGRTRPDPAWQADPAWRDLLRIVPLRNLGPKESQQYLLESGIGAGTHDRIIQITHGHPLGLSLITDVVTRGGDATAEPLSPELVATLLRQFLDVVPRGEHRRALEVCALARVTTEPLLRAALDVDDAHEVFEWLRTLSFVESGPNGVFPHDLARDVLDADLHWRDPEAYNTTFRRISDHIIARLATTRGLEQQRVLFDAKFMHRRQAVSQVWADWDSFGQHHADPAQAADRVAVVDLIDMWEGAESAAIAARWLDRQPGGFMVVRQPDGQVRGVLALLDLTAASPDDLAADRAACLAWEYTLQQGPLRPGERVTQTRFIVDREAYQHPSPTMNLAPVLSIQHYLQTPGLCLDFITIADPERFDDYFSFFEIRRVPGSDCSIGGRRFGLFVRDFRRIPLDAWLRLMFERDLVGDDAAPPASPSLPVVVLSQPDFAVSVRQALRDLRRSDRLAANPLLRSRLVLAHADGEASVQTLREIVQEAAERLRADPRDEKLFRVVDRTFLHPAAGQEKAAEVLNLPLSTYKRHLKNAVERIVADLWGQELGRD